LTFSTLNLYKTWTHKTTLTYTALQSFEWNRKIYNTEPSYFNDDTDLIIETGTSGFINEVLSPTSGLTLSTKDYAAVKIEEVKIDRERFYSSDQLHVYKNNENWSTRIHSISLKQKLNLRIVTLFYFDTTNQVKIKTENISSSI
jgi:hypothetical protein